MTRFLYLADSHLGGQPTGYQQQQRYCGKLPEILAALQQFLDARGDIDFILHGGDMIDVTTDDDIVAAVEMFRLSVPVYLCLGNHDLTEPDALARWVALAPALFGPTERPEFRIKTGNGVIHVVPNHWQAQPYYWEDAQDVYLSDEQLAFLEEGLAEDRHLPHLLLTHSPVFGLPPAQTGFAEPFHSPPEPFTTSITSLANAHPQLVAVLGAHNHLNMCVRHQGVDYITASSLLETPFEFKLIELTTTSLAMSTLALRDDVGFDTIYDDSKAYVQGREEDRALSREFRLT